MQSGVTGSLALIFLLRNARFPRCKIRVSDYALRTTGIWIVIPSECCWLPLSVVSKAKIRGGTSDSDQWPQFAMWHNSACHLLWQKLMGRQRRGQIHWARFCFYYLTKLTAAPHAQGNHHSNRCLKNTIVINFYLLLRAGFIGAMKQTYDP